MSGLTVAFISHDLSVIRHLCVEVIVLNHDETVNRDWMEQVFEAPKSDISKSLPSAILLPELDGAWLD